MLGRVAQAGAQRHAIRHHALGGSRGRGRALIGNKLRPEQYLRDASVDSITIFANGVGDLNPLYRDLEYARWTRFGG